jgi:FixJ family two-component response regulator
MTDDTLVRDLFVLDDDAAMRDTLAAVFALAGYRVSVFAEAETFLAAARIAAPSAVLLDLNLPAMSGLDILRELDAPHFPAPIIMISGVGDISSAVEAVKGGASDYIVKPFDARTLVMRVDRAVADAARTRVQHGVSAFSGEALLTPRERDVLSEIAGGASNKEAGRRLGISPRTVEVHRARIMDKTGARNTADLVRIVLGGAPLQRRHARGTAPSGMIA